MEWFSEDYIGAGGDLIEVFSGDEGRNQTRLRGNTVATRIGVYDDNGITVIVSQLHIVAFVQFLMSSVTCRINSRGPTKTINFNVTGMKSCYNSTYAYIYVSLQFMQIIHDIQMYIQVQSQSIKKN
jgi:hypothetical protein